MYYFIHGELINEVSLVTGQKKVNFFVESFYMFTE